MFPPTSPQTERVRAELENQEIERRAALAIRVPDGENRNLIRALIARLMTRERKPAQTDLQTSTGVPHRAEQTI